MTAQVPRQELPFVQDLRPSGLLHATVAFAAKAPVRLVDLDVSEALASPGVQAVLTAADVEWQPRLRHAPLLARGVVLSTSDRLALVAAETPEQARLAARRVRATSQDLSAVYDAFSAHLENAPPVWSGEHNLHGVTHFKRGNAAAACQRGPYTLHRRYTLPWQDALGT